MEGGGLSQPITVHLKYFEISKVIAVNSRCLGIDLDNVNGAWNFDFYDSNTFFWSVDSINIVSIDVNIFISHLFPSRLSDI